MSTQIVNVALWLGLSSFLFLPSGVSSASEAKLHYKLVSNVVVPFGAPIAEPYIVDVFDIDGKGGDGFALSAMTKAPADAFKVRSAPKDFSKLLNVHSFIVQNLSASKTFKLVDLGDAGLTHRTWAGRFLRRPGDSSTYFVLGRNGEIGWPNEIPGEHTSIFKIKTNGDKWDISNVFVSKSLNVTASVSLCDFTGGGSPDVFVNNYDGPLASANSRPRIISFQGDVFSEQDASYSAFAGMVDKVAHNDVLLADIAGDGACDFLGANEIWGGGLTPPSARNSYMLRNVGGHFDGPPIPLPNPLYGAEQAGFSLAVTKDNGENLIALDSSRNPNGNSPYKGFSLQLFSYRNGQFVEQTREKLSGQIVSPHATANQARVRFSDIDGDGKPDIYFSVYRGPVEVYLYRNGKYVLQTIPVSVTGWMNAVAFLRSPNHTCADLAVLDGNGHLRRYNCQ